MDRPQLLKEHGRRPARWKLLTAYALAFAGLLWVMRDVPWRGFPEQLAAVKWPWVAAAVLLDVLSYACQGLRWRSLLLPKGRLRWLRSTQAIYAGLFTNEILPMRLGEGVRAYLVSRWMRRAFSEIVPSILVERVLDGITLTGAMLVTGSLILLPQTLVRATKVLSLSVLMLVGLLGIAVFLSRKSPAARSRRLGQISVSICQSGFSRHTLMAAALSALLLGLQAGSFWTAMVGYGIDSPLWQGCAVLLIVRLLTALPGTPANIGTFQLACVLGLTLFGVPRELAAGFSIFGFLVLTLPLWLLGMLAIGKSGTTLTEMRRRGSLGALNAA